MAHNQCDRISLAGVLEAFSRAAVPLIHAFSRVPDTTLTA
jgi:hypothetical protein